MKYSILRRIIFCLICFAGALAGAGLFLLTAEARGSGEDSSLVRRRYYESEKFSYKMSALNRERRKTIRYEAQANVIVKKDSAGLYYEEISWSDLIINESRVPTGASEFRQICSLDPAFKLKIPNLSKVNPFLIGPIADLITMYADLQLTNRTPGLRRPGDHAHIKNSRPNSWADGRRVRIGEDQLDFDITLKEIDDTKNTATVIVRHSPPLWSNVNMPVEWMYHPIDSTPNNWVQVSRDEKGIYVGAIGHESSEVQMTVSTVTGALLSARIENLVNVLQRDCTDSTLAQCGDTTRYSIRRQIELQRIP